MGTAWKNERHNTRTNRICHGVRKATLCNSAKSMSPSTGPNFGQPHLRPKVVETRHFCPQRSCSSRPRTEPRNRTGPERIVSPGSGLRPPTFKRTSKSPNFGALRARPLRHAPEVCIRGTIAAPVRPNDEAFRRLMCRGPHSMTGEACAFHPRARHAAAYAGKRRARGWGGGGATRVHPPEWGSRARRASGLHLVPMACLAGSPYPMPILRHDGANPWGCAAA